MQMVGLALKVGASWRVSLHLTKEEFWKHMKISSTSTPLEYTLVIFSDRFEFKGRLKDIETRRIASGFFGSALRSCGNLLMGMRKQEELQDGLQCLQ